MADEPKRLLEDEARSPMNTDDAEPYAVLNGVGYCAAHWVPEARIIGNVRAGDIVRAVDAVRSENAQLRARLAALEAVALPETVRPAIDRLRKIVNDLYYEGEDDGHEIWLDLHMPDTRITLGECRALLAHIEQQARTTVPREDVEKAIAEIKAAKMLVLQGEYIDGYNMALEVVLTTILSRVVAQPDGEGR